MTLCISKDLWIALIPQTDIRGSAIVALSWLHGLGWLKEGRNQLCNFALWLGFGRNHNLEIVLSRQPCWPADIIEKTFARING